ncbi:hypothetical protein D6D04_02938 [Aureobasidium pullulans]|nr:hypothetical protein D6D04_02938 [Aureobasidium pullulans]
MINSRVWPQPRRKKEQQPLATPIALCQPALAIADTTLDPIEPLVLQLALNVAGGPDPDFILEINNVQSPAVDVAFLPQIRKHDGGGLRHVDKRTDFAIAVDIERSSHVHADPEQLFLSPMTDAYTATLPLMCGLEVKRLDGS